MESNANSTTPQSSLTTQPPVRTWRTALWLWLVLIVNVIVGLFTLFNLFDAQVAPASGIVVLSGLLTFATAAGALLLLRWIRVGFYIILGVAAVQLVISPFAGGNIFCGILSPFIHVGLIYYVLQYPKENKVWDHLS